MITAMIDTVADKGYVKTTVGDILNGAGVSRATFYEQFTDKADCFRATYASVTDLLAQLMDAALESLADDGSSSDPIARIDTLVGWYLDLLVQSPSLAKVFLVEVYAAGPPVIGQRRATIDSFVELISTVLADTPFEGTRDDQEFTIRALVTALVGMVTEATVAGELDRVTEFRKPFSDLVVRSLGRSSSGRAPVDRPSFDADE